MCETKILQTQIHPEHHNRTRDSEDWNQVGHVRATKKETTLVLGLLERMIGAFNRTWVHSANSDYFKEFER